MKTKLLAIAFLALSASAQTFSCAGCVDYGPIGSTGYTMQYGPRLTYTADGLDAGVYRLDITFVEPLYSTTNQRPLNVLANNIQVLSGFDVTAAGGYLNPVVRSVLVAPINGKVTVILTANDTGTAAKPVKHSAIISAITLVKLSGGSPSTPTPPVAQSTACQLSLISPKLVSMSACPIQISGVFYMIPMGQIGPVSGTGFARLGIDKSASPPVGKVFFSATVQGACVGMGGCVVAEPGADYISDVLPVGLWTISNGTFDPNGYTPMVATIQGVRIMPETGLVQEQTGHTIKIRVNTEVFPVQ